MKPGNLTPRLYFLRKRRELRKLGATKEDLKKFDEYNSVVDSYQKSEWFYMKGSNV